MIFPRPKGLSLSATHHPQKVIRPEGICSSTTADGEKVWQELLLMVQMVSRITIVSVVREISMKRGIAVEISQRSWR